MEGTTEFHHDIADALLPEADPVFDTAINMLDPQPTLVQSLVRGCFEHLCDSLQRYLCENALG